MREVIMSSADNSTGPVRPSKPTPDFPLYAHPSGSWAKTIAGKKHYFGPWSDPDGALAAYLAAKDNLEKGFPRDYGEPVTDGSLYDLVYKFLGAKKARRDNGELAAQTYRDYERTADHLLKALGKKRPVDSLYPVDFAKLRARLAKTNGLVRLANEVTRVKVIFKWAREQKLIRELPSYGEFECPRPDLLKKHRKGNPKRFSSDEVRRILAAADVRMRAMLMLGIGNALGTNDIVQLKFQCLDLDAGWLTYPRPKTGSDRRSKLWPETIEALRGWLAIRPKPSNPADASIVFATTIRDRKTREAKTVRDTSDSIAKAMRKLLDGVGVADRGFYGLRHSFRGAADPTHDLPAIRLAMGHDDHSIDDNYRGSIDDSRLVAIAEHVRTWLGLDSGKAVRS
jgi:integrase